MEAKLGDMFAKYERTEGFDDFWSRWPDKRNKHNARKAWAKMRRSERKLATERCVKWCEQWRKDNPQASHIHASTYLNQKRWEDLDEQGEKATRSKDEIARFWAEKINGGGFVPRNAISAEIKAHMVFTNLVDADTLRAFE